MLPIKRTFPSLRAPTYEGGARAKNVQLVAQDTLHIS